MVWNSCQHLHYTRWVNQGRLEPTDLLDFIFRDLASIFRWPGGHWFCGLEIKLLFNISLQLIIPWTFKFPPATQSLAVSFVIFLDLSFLYIFNIIFFLTLRIFHLNFYGLVIYSSFKFTMLISVFLEFGQIIRRFSSNLGVDFEIIIGWFEIIV